MNFNFKQRLSTIRTTMLQNPIVMLSTIVGVSAITIAFLLGINITSLALLSVTATATTYASYRIFSNHLQSRALNPLKNSFNRLKKLAGNFIKAFRGEIENLEAKNAVLQTENNELKLETLEKTNQISKLKDDISELKNKISDLENPLGLEGGRTSNLLRFATENRLLNEENQRLRATINTNTVDPKDIFAPPPNYR